MNARTFTQADLIDEAMCHETPGHELLSLERDDVIQEGQAKSMLLEAGGGWFDTLLEVEDRFIRERRVTADLRRELENKGHQITVQAAEITKLRREHLMLVNCLEEARDDVEKGQMPSYAYIQRTLAAWGAA